MMKKMLVALLVCLTACSLCGCATKCHVYEECGKTIEKSSENKNPLGKGHLCEEHLEEATRLVEEYGTTDFDELIEKITEEAADELK